MVFSETKSKNYFKIYKQSTSKIYHTNWHKRTIVTSKNQLNWKFEHNKTNHHLKMNILFRIRKDATTSSTIKTRTKLKSSKRQDKHKECRAYQQHQPSQATSHLCSTDTLTKKHSYNRDSPKPNTDGEHSHAFLLHPLHSFQH